MRRGRDGEPLREHRLLLAGILRFRPRHHEDVLAGAHAVVGRAGLGVAAVATRGLAASGFVVVRGLDLREGDGVRTEAAKFLVLAREHLPERILGDRHAAGLERRAVGRGDSTPSRNAFT